VTTSETNDLDLLARDAVVVSSSARELAVATGADRVRFLHGVITADVAGTAVGQGCRSVLLTPKGHVVADMHLFVRPDAIWIVVDAGQAGSVASSLARYAIMDDFAAAPEPDFAIVSVLGPRAAERLRAIGLVPGTLADASPLAHADVTLEGSALWLARVRELGAAGFWLGGRRAAVENARTRLMETGVLALAPEAAEGARIAALEPRFGAEITTDYFPMEVGLSGAIDYNKGCYLGQEPIVRIRDRGHINWRLVGLDVDGGVEPSAGDPLETDAKPKAGKVTSAARLPDGRGVALAMLHVSVPVGGEVRIRHGETPLTARVRGET
jgi:folate-binding protein YgfZ